MFEIYFFLFILNHRRFMQFFFYLFKKLSYKKCNVYVIYHSNKMLVMCFFYLNLYIFWLILNFKCYKNENKKSNNKIKINKMLIVLIGFYEVVFILLIVCLVIYFILNVFQWTTNACELLFVKYSQWWYKFKLQYIKN